MRNKDSGFYESYFLRANHPNRPLAFWIRYTVFAPEGRPDQARGELWAIYFDGEKMQNIAVKEAFPISDCNFSIFDLDVRIGNAHLTDRFLHGRAASVEHVIDWTLNYGGHESPLLLLPESQYHGYFPRAKALVGAPNAVFKGTVKVDGAEIPIDGWTGSQNHNWGTRHTDSYAWGQVAGFDNAPDAFLECATVQLKVGPIWTPRLTFLVLRDEGRQVALNGLLQSARASADFNFFSWSFESRDSQVHTHGCIKAPATAFVALRYENPPGGSKTCINTKLASAEITVHRRGRPTRTLVTRYRAAFEILTDKVDHGVPIVA
jgi:hypothetical protein